MSSGEEHPETPEDASGTAAEAEGPPSIETLQAQLDEAERERVQFKTMAQRAQADHANYRKRVEEEREDLYRSAIGRVIAKLLSIEDDLQRAVDHTPVSSEETSWMEGVRMIERSLHSLLESEGVTPIEADGKPFDPWEHEALFTVENPEMEPGTVATVIRAGYKMNGKVIRAAQVAVSQDSERENQEQAKQEQPDAREADHQAKTEGN